MKHLKIFEDLYKFYNVGDFVYLDLIKINKNSNIYEFIDKTPTSPLAKIIECEPDFDYPYAVEIPSNHNDCFNFDVAKDEILRLLTDDEIKDYNLKVTANKYNL